MRRRVTAELAGCCSARRTALFFLALCTRLPAWLPWPGRIDGLMLFTIPAWLPPPAARSALTGAPEATAMAAVLFGLALVCWGWRLKSFAQRDTQPRRARC